MEMYTKQHNTINERGIWHYLLDTPIGHIHVVEYEAPTKELVRFITDGDNDRAERKFASICKGILNGKL
jgi:hypothetical protein